MNSRDHSRGLGAAVLIGGNSSRMGVPKSLLRANGTGVLAKLVAAAGRVAGDVVLVGEAPVPPELCGMERLADAPGVEGPLGGVLAAFRWRRRPWMILSCDLPLMTAQALRWLASHATTNAMAVMPHRETPDTPEPLAALYLPAAASVIEQRAREGERSLRRIFAGAGLASPRIPSQFRRAFRNVNTPDEWREVLKEIETHAVSA